MAAKLLVMLEMIKFQHSVFALPFAIMSAFFAAGGVPETKHIIWILVAMVSARSAAMSFNRIADARLDSMNPRTLERAIPAGKLGLTFAWVFTYVSSAIFVFSAFMLNALVFKLSFAALFVIMTYSFTKRFTVLSHFILGLSLGIAPMGAWLAIRGSFDLFPMLISTGVIFWTAGFDIIYSTLDCEFDKEQGLRSIPARFGVKAALNISVMCHFIAFLAFASLYYVGQLGFPYIIGCAVVAMLLSYEHRIVKPDNLRKVNTAFFYTNAIVSLAIMSSSLVSLFLYSKGSNV